MRRIFILLAVLTLIGSCKDDVADPQPLIPTLLEATNITNTTFDLNWEVTVQPQSYSIDIGTDNTFVADFFTFDDISGDLRSIKVEGLESNTTYFSRMRGVNGATSSPNSSFREVRTLPDAPLAVSAIDIESMAFTARWQQVQDISIYELDIALDSDFTNYLENFESREVFGLNYLVSGLTPGTTYYYRVRAKDIGVSANSNIIEVTTVQ